MQIAKCFYVPVNPEVYTYPKVIYSDIEIAGIYFETDDEQYARVTFENIDSIKIIRGEYLPYTDDCDYKQDMPCWIYKVENSEWLKQRFEYEKKYYKTSYEWGGSVNEMLTDFAHYVFRFHDQIVEVIAKGYWIEKSAESLAGKPLLPKHPFLPISNGNNETIAINNTIFNMVKSPLPEDELIRQTQFCSQTVVEFTKEDTDSPDYKYVIFIRNNELTSCIENYFGTKKYVCKGFLSFDNIKDVFIKLKKDNKL